VSGSFFDLFLHLIVALGVVLGSIWLLARVLRFKARGGAFALRRLSKLTVVERRNLAKGASVALVRVGDKLVLLGITSHSVSMLSEMESIEAEDGVDPEEVASPLLSLGGRSGEWGALGRELTLGHLGRWQQGREDSTGGQWRAVQSEGVVPLKAWMSTKLEQLRELTVRRS